MFMLPWSHILGKIPLQVFVVAIIVCFPIYCVNIYSSENNGLGCVIEVDFKITY